MASALERFRLDGRVALVTGGSGNAGRAIVQTLADAGCAVVVASRNAGRCAAVAAEVEAGGGDAFGHHLDLADPASIEGLVGATIQRLGRIDVLVNNAVSHYPGHVEALPLSSWESAMRVDSSGLFLLTQAVLREMIRTGSGSIVNVASVLGMVSAEPDLYPGGLESFRPSYFFAKGGMISYSRFIAATYAEHGIRSNCVSPGGIETVESSKPLTRWAERTPMKRLARQEEIASAVLFLASDAASYVTGHNLVVDGGYTAW